MDIRCLKADGGTALSKDVWRIHEMYRKSISIVFLALCERPAGGPGDKTKSIDK